MTKYPTLIGLLFAFLMLSACSLALEPTVEKTPLQAELDLKPTTGNRALDPITLPISVYILDDAEETLSSARSEEEIDEIFTKVNEIWAAAGVQMDVQTVARVSTPSGVLAGLGEGRLRLFFEAAGTVVQVPGTSLLNGFYAQSIGGPNGITPLAGTVFFVADESTVYDERVTSHEIGHILGLHHTLSDQNRLMFPGTNGMALTEEEIAVARYFAQGLLDDVR